MHRQCDKKISLINKQRLMLNHKLNRFSLLTYKIYCFTVLVAKNAKQIIVSLCNVKRVQKISYQKRTLKNLKNSLFLEG